MLPIRIISEDGFPPVPTIQYVINGFLILDPGFRAMPGTHGLRELVVERDSRSDPTGFPVLIVGTLAARITPGHFC